MKITLAAPSVCPELYSYMYFLDLSLQHSWNYVQFASYQPLPFLTETNGQSNHTSSMITIPKTYF